jgi:hypothetical protein
VKIIKDPKVESLTEFKEKRKHSVFTTNFAPKAQYQDFLLIYDRSEEAIANRQSSNL